MPEIREDGNLAGIEILRNDWKMALKFNHEFAKKLKDIGFSYVTLDIETFSSGSMSGVLWTYRR